VPADPPVLSLRGISKRFGAVQALDDVSMECRRGEVHAVVGENGSGKSTLLGIASGVLAPDAGEIEIAGRRLESASAGDAQAYGLGMAYQTFSGVLELSVAENVFLSTPKASRPRYGDMERWAAEVIAPYDLDVPVGAQMGGLSLAQRQMLEVVKALQSDPKVLLLDEPTTSLGPQEVERLHAMVLELAARGVGVIYVSHRLDEVFAHCDRFSVMKDGRLVESGSVKDVDRDRLVRLMVGREVSEAFPDRRPSAGPTVLRVEELSVEGKLHDIDLDVRAGEIVGVAGLMGSGRTTLAKAIFGAIPVSEGTTVEVGESRGPFPDPRAALAAGVAYLPEDRRREGLATRKSVKMNTTLLGLDRVSGGIPRLIRPRAERQMVGDAISRFSIRASPEGRDLVMRLSGGNQQKVVLAKWLEAGPKVLILDEPTRGVDVGSKQEIYRILRDLANEGLGIVVISSELIEVLGLADRIVIMCEGRIAGELPGGAASEEDLMRLATTAGETAHEEELR
jgi:ABC-type sugar transport system ATPase subunit